MAAMEYPDPPVNTLIDFRRKAVSAAYIREMKALGDDNLSPKMLADFRWYGVSLA
jgi:hypothetical protein